MPEAISAGIPFPRDHRLTPYLEKQINCLSEQMLDGTVLIERDLL